MYDMEKIVTICNPYVCFSLGMHIQIGNVDLKAKLHKKG